MDIKILGFQWHLCSAISLDELYGVLETDGKQSCIKLNHYLSGTSKTPVDRLLVVIREHGYWKGAVVRIKDIKAFFKVTAEKGKMTLSAEELAANTQVVEVNFFILKEASLKGLYQYYHQSTWINTFCNDCNLHYQVIGESKIKAIKIRANAERWTKRKLDKELNSVHSLTYDILVRPESVDYIIEKMKLIRNVNITFSSLQNVPNEMRPLAAHSRPIMHRFVFNKNRSMLDIRSEIKKLVVDGKLRKMRLEGTDSNSVEQVINLQNNYDFFEKIPYDDVASDIAVDFSDIAGSLRRSNIIKRLDAIAAKPTVNRRLS